MLVYILATFAYNCSSTLYPNIAIKNMTTAPTKKKNFGNPIVLLTKAVGPCADPDILEEGRILTTLFNFEVVCVDPKSLDTLTMLLFFFFWRVAEGQH